MQLNNINIGQCMIISDTCDTKHDQFKGQGYARTGLEIRTSLQVWTDLDLGTVTQNQPT